MKKGFMIVIVVVITAALIFAGWYIYGTVSSDKELDEESPLDMDMPGNASLVAQGSFAGSDHDVKGTAKIIQVDNGHVLRLEDFETESGPDLYVYLSVDNGDNDFVDLGKIKATKGNINYNIPEGTDITEYDHALIWCRPFKVLFGSAKLTAVTA